MTAKYSYITTTLLVIIIFSASIAQTNHKELFEKAKYTMETKGDLKSAINLFDEIIKKYPAEIEYAAKSQLYIGLCYQKLGLAEAKKAFERVINNYPTQIEIVSLARKKLSVLKMTEKNIKSENKDFQLQQVWAKLYDDHGSPSPDGRFISYVNWNVPCLAVYNINNGESKDILSTKGTWEGDQAWAENSIWSPDGKKLAYVWYGKNVNSLSEISIRVVGIDSSEPEVILADENAEFSQPCSWSSDGKHILAVLCHGDQGHEIIFVSVDDHSIKSLIKLEGGSHPWTSLSPDNKIVAYSFTPDLNSPKTDIYLLNIANGKETVLINHPETDFNPLWMPDGKNIIFFSDRTGTVSVWSQQVSEGKAVGEEKLIKNLNRLTPKAITKNGDLFMTFHEGGYDVYNAIIDPETGKVISAPKRAVETNIGWNGGASFSPDGKSMAYVSQRGVLNTSISWGQQSLVIRDLQSGEERELIPRLRQLIRGPFTPPMWSPAGDEFVVTGRSEVGHNGAFIINPYDTSHISLTENDDLIRSNYTWSKDNKNLFCLLRGVPEKNGLYLINRESMEPTRILSEDNIFLMNLHPDGNLMAFVTFDAIKVLNLNNNKLEVLYKDKMTFPNFTMDWSPDGKWLYFVRWNREKKHAELWRITYDGKDLQQVDITLPDLRFLSIHPDGKQIVFTVGVGDENKSFWVMKNFLTK